MLVFYMSKNTYFCVDMKQIVSLFAAFVAALSLQAQVKVSIYETAQGQPVIPADFKAAKISGNKVKLTLPAASIVVLEVK